MKKKLIMIMLCISALTGCRSGGVDDTFELVDEREPEVQEEVQEEASGILYIHVCGYVNNPGVYELESGSRICQAIEKAGGLKAGAAENQINQAELITDGQQIYVPSIQELEEQKEASAEGGKINLNTATVEQLTSLSGIGESKAESIIQYREDQGGFKAIEDLMNVPGIKEGTFRKIQDDITV